MSADLVRWAERQYRNRATDPPLSGAVFAIEQLEVHARGLAVTHEVGPGRSGDRLLERLADSERVIGRCSDLMSSALAVGGRMTPAAEWVLDNQYLIDEQIALTRRHFPRGYCRSLPQLVRGERAGLPRVHDLIMEFIAHVDGRVDDEALARYVGAYQSVTHLSLGELWSVAIMLRLALIENLRRVAASISWQRAHRDAAMAWAKRLDAPSEEHESALLVLAEMVREDPPLSTAFVAQFTQALQGRGATTTFVLAWLEQRLAAVGQNIEDVVRAESQRQEVDQVSMANSIASLRLVGATDWHRFVEANSATEEILRGEPAGVYARMDFATRDEYRHVVEATARRLHLDEEVVARGAVAMAAAQHDSGCAAMEAHVGYVLVGRGRGLLQGTLRGRPSSLPSHRLLRGLKLLAYLGPIALLTAAGTLWLSTPAWGGAGSSWLVLMVCAALAVSQCAVALVNWFASLVRKPRALPRMDFEHGIPDECRTMAVVPTLLTEAHRVGALLEGLELRYLASSSSSWKYSFRRPGLDSLNA